MSITLFYKHFHYILGGYGYHDWGSRGYRGYIPRKFRGYRGGFPHYFNDWMPYRNPVDER